MISTCCSRMLVAWLVSSGLRAGGSDWTSVGSVGEDSSDSELLVLWVYSEPVFGLGFSHYSCFSCSFSR